MDFQIIFLAIAAIFWIVKKISEFNKQTQNQQGDFLPDDKQVVVNESFEELLEQFTEENRAFNKQHAKNREREQSVSKRRSNKAFEKFQGTQPKEAIIETFQGRRNIHYTIKKKKKNKYAKMMNDPKDVKKAFVGSLIFDRKF